MSLVVAPYAGQNQTQLIDVPRAILYQSHLYSPEEGPWAMLPYASLYPPGSQTAAVAVVPPPIKMTDIFSAQQTWPL
jgi:hypothetical protein